MIIYVKQNLKEFFNKICSLQLQCKGRPWPAPVRVPVQPPPRRGAATGVRCGWQQPSLHLWVSRDRRVQVLAVLCWPRCMFYWCTYYKYSIVCDGARHAQLVLLPAHLYWTFLYCTFQKVCLWYNLSLVKIANLLKIYPEEYFTHAYSSFLRTEGLISCLKNKCGYLIILQTEINYTSILTMLSSATGWWNLLHMCMVIWRRINAATTSCGWLKGHHPHLPAIHTNVHQTLHRPRPCHQWSQVPPSRSKLTAVRQQRPCSETMEYCFRCMHCYLWRGGRT